MTNNILSHLQQSVIAGDIDSAIAYAQEWLKAPASNPLTAVEKGLTPGILQVGKLYEDGEYFLPELIASAEAMKSALNILRPAIVSSGNQLEKGKVIMATIEGDIHEIGKSIVSAILEASGYRVYDLGPDVKLNFLYNKIEELQPDVVGLSALLTTTMINQKRAVQEIKKRGYACKVIVGGAPVSKSWANEIGANGYGKDAFEAVEIVDNLVKVKDKRLKVKGKKSNV
jgi:corrinoid protein of di/trimethylamine methyltransferase